MIARQTAQTSALLQRGRVCYTRSIDYNNKHSPTERSAEIVKYKQFTVFVVRKLSRQTKCIII